MPHPLPKCPRCNKRLIPGELLDCPHGYPAPLPLPKQKPKRLRSAQETDLLKAVDDCLHVAQLCMDLQSLSKALQGLHVVRKRYDAFEDLQVFDAEALTVDGFELEPASLMQITSQQSEDLTIIGPETASTKPGDVLTFDHPDGTRMRAVAPIPFRPLHNQVVIRVLREKDMIGSIVLPESANDNKTHGAIGIVIAKGLGHRRKSTSQTTGPKPERAWLGGYSPLPVELGDHVVFARSSGEAHKFAGETYLVTPVEHVMCVLENYETDRAVATEREFGLQGSLEKNWNRAASEFPRVEGNRGQ